MKILFVVHAAPWAEFSGTPLITGQYAQRAMARGWEVAFLVPDTAANRSPAPDVYQPVTMVYWPTQVHWSIKAFAATPGLRTTAPIEIDFQPDIVHIVDWVFMESSVLAALAALNAPIVRQVWNFEDLCSEIEPIHRLPGGHTCVAPLNPRDCAECLLRRAEISIPGGKHNYLELTEKLEAYKRQFINRGARAVAHRQLVAADHFAKLYDKVLFPTRSFFDYFNSHLKLSGDHEILEHGVFVKGASAAKVQHDGLNFIYAGGMAKRKGWPAIVQAFSRLYDEGVENVRLRVYGDRAHTEKSTFAKYPNVEFRDAYNMDNMAEAFAWADIGLAPTQFETFCRIVREYILCGVVPIASHAFGIPDVVEHGRNGILLDEPSGDSLYQAIRRLLDDPGAVARLKAGCAATPITSPEAEFDRLCEIYQDLRAGPKRLAQSASGVPA